MQLISREDLQRKLDEGEDLKLVCALKEWAFRAMHIPGSFHIDGPGLVAELLEIDDQIVVYCSNVNCVASVMAYDRLVESGYSNVWRPGGLGSGWATPGRRACATRMTRRRAS